MKTESEMDIPEQVNFSDTTFVPCTELNTKIERGISEPVEIDVQPRPTPPPVPPRHSILQGRNNILIDQNCLIMEKELDSGQFGQVYHAKYLTDGKKIDVAVKMVKSECQSKDELGESLGEAKIMHSFKHDNVLHLIGLSMTSDFTPMVVLPYMPNGSLLKYVKGHDDLTKVQIMNFAMDVANGK